MYAHGDAGGECLCVLIYHSALFLTWILTEAGARLEMSKHGDSPASLFHSKEITGMHNHARLSCESWEFTLKSSCLCRKTLTTEPSPQLPLELFQTSLSCLLALISAFNRWLPTLKLTPALPTCSLFTYESHQLVQHYQGCSWSQE